MTSNFGGKKAAPFRKGGKPRKAIVAKAVVAKARRAKREMALSVITGREIDLGRDGSKWRHGWIPLNPQAVALKAHHSKGGSGVDNPAEHMGKIREHIAETARRAATQSEGIAAHTDRHVGPNGWGRVRVEKKIDAHGTRTKYNVQTNENAGMHKSYDSAEKAAVALHRHLYGAPKDNSEKTAWRAGAQASEPGGKSELEKAFDAEGMARDTHGHGSKQHEAARAKRMGIEAQVKKKSDPGYTTGTGRSISFPSNPHNQGGLEASRARAREAAVKKTSKGDISFPKNEHNSGGLEASRVRSGGLSNQALIKNAEKMFGTGSKQHLAAKARFGPKLGPVKTDTGGKRFVEERKGNLVTRHYEDGSVTILDARKKAGTNRTIGHVANSPSNRFPGRKK